MANERVHVESDLWWETTVHRHELRDADGNPLGVLPKSFTDDQVRAAVQLANEWYAAGQEHGKNGALANLRDALGIKPVAAH